MRVNMRTRSIDDLRLLRSIFDAGQSIADSQGGVEDVTLSATLELCGVANETACRLFEAETISDDNFRLDLVADQRKSGDATVIQAVVDAVMSAESERLATRDPVHWALVGREMMRQGMNCNAELLRGRADWEIHVAAQRCTNTPSSFGAEQLARFRRVSDVSRGRMFDLYGEIATGFGIRPREPLTIEEFASTTFGVMEGLAMQEFHSGNDGITMRPTGPDGSLQEWSVGAIMFEALVLASFEPDPWADVAADVSVWQLQPTR